MREHHEGRQQIVCGSYPAGFPETYVIPLFLTMISDAKAVGWSIRPTEPSANPRDTTDLFGKAPDAAGKAKPQCATNAPQKPQGSLI